MFGVYIGRKTTFLALADAALILLALYAAYVLRFFEVRPALLHTILSEWTGASAIVLTVHLLAFYVFELYNLQLDFRRVRNLLRCVGAVATAAGVVATAGFVLPEWGFGRGMFALHALVLAAATAGSRALVSGMVRRRQPPERALLVTGDGIPREVLDELSTNPESRFHIVGVIPGGAKRSSIPPIGSFGDVEEILHRERCRTLIVAGIGTLEPEKVRELLRLKTSGTEVRELYREFQRLSGRVPMDHLQATYFLLEPGFAGESGSIVNNLLRVFDVCVAAALLVASLPLWALATLGIKLTMPGPVFYSQERLGKDEKPYVLHKFRTMVPRAEEDGPRWSGPGDPRVTRFGRFLRRTRIDELPQLWNVLRGDMALVGPRPERRVFVDQLKAQIPHYGLRYAVRPGLTGWAQVNYGYGSTIDDARIKLSYDLYFIQERSLVLTALILLKTVQTVLFKPGS